MYDLSYLDAKEMIFFMMGKLHLSAEMFIKKWKISSQETFLYSLMSSMLLTQVQELKRKDLDYHYEIELKHLNLKLKSFVEKYCKERDSQIQASKIKRTQQEHAEITLYANSNVEEDLPELVEIAPDENQLESLPLFKRNFTLHS
jgi:phosphopantetheine adenylyltransferase